MAHLIDKSDQNNVNDRSAGAVAVAVVGARGYSGVELCRLLLRHPQADLVACFATATAGFKLSDYLPESAAREMTGYPTEVLLPLVDQKNIRVVFLATPVEASLELAPKLIAAGVHVIDLSGAFRLKEGDKNAQVANYRRWYNVQHSELNLLSRAEFGLVPWAKENETQIDEPRLIANPGCFATAILMGLLPLLKQKLIDPNSIVLDAKSGTTGAGRKAEERLLHAEVEGLCLPYRIGCHQHEPEIEQYLRHFSGATVDPFLTTHLLASRRGIIAGIYARVSTDVLSRHVDLATLVRAAYAEVYGADPLVEFGQIGSGGDRLLNLRRVVGSARTQIAFKIEGSRVYVFSLIDNLMKGAASQAVENYNRLIGSPTWLGLNNVEGVL
jgi:N-acetyl-gamma-glutamyl-phosphate reductase